MKLAGKKVLITGASSGIGAATAREFAGNGCEVILLARNLEALEQLAAELRQGGSKAHSYSADLAEPEQVAEIASRIEQEVGVPDILFNNAGAGKWRFVPETEAEEALAMIKLPYLAAFYITKAFLPQMLERGEGAIYNMTSAAAFFPFAGATSYIAARSAMVGFHEALHADLFFEPVHTGLVYFAKIKSSYWQNNPGSEERLPKAQALIPSLSPEQAARIIVRGVARKRTAIRGPVMLKIMEVLARYFPFITKRITYYTGYRG